MSRLIIISTLFFLLLPHAPVAAAEKQLPEPGTIETLTVAVNRLAAALETEQKETSDKTTLEKLNLAVAYLSFRSRRIESLDRDISSMKIIRTNLEEAQKTWNERITALEERERQSQGQTSEDLDRMIVESKTQLAVFKERQSRMEDEIIQLENRNYELQREINVIEKFVERHLAF